MPLSMRATVASASKRQARRPRSSAARTRVVVALIGRYFAFTRYIAGKSPARRLAVLDRHTGKVTVLTKAGKGLFEPTFVPRPFLAEVGSGDPSSMTPPST